MAVRVVHCIHQLHRSSNGRRSTVKYCSLVFVHRRRRRFYAVPPPHASEYITYAMASALGFSTLENIAFIYQTCQSESGWQFIALTVFERVGTGASLHAMTACLLAIKIVRRDLRGEQHTTNLWHVLQLPVLLHGTFNFALFCIRSAANGHIGWVPRNGISFVAVLALAVGVPVVTLMAWRAEIRKYRISQLWNEIFVFFFLTNANALGLTGPD